MARHSHWHNIQITKGKADAKRAASFTKLAREITVSAREKGGDPEMNARLRAAIDRAREASMPKDNIDRAIQRGVGGGDGGTLETLTYEGYGPGGTALVIECVTDNRNRSANEVKHLLSKHGGTIAATGAVTYLFERVAAFRMYAPFAEGREALELSLIEAGATRIEETADGLEVFAEPGAFSAVADVLRNAKLATSAAEFAWIPKTTVEVDMATAQAVSNLIDILEADDDVSRVFHNLA